MLLGQSANERNHELRRRPEERHPYGGAWIEILCKAFDREWQTGAAKQNGSKLLAIGQAEAAGSSACRADCRSQPSNGMPFPHEWRHLKGWLS